MPSEDNEEGLLSMRAKILTLVVLVVAVVMLVYLAGEDFAHEARLFLRNVVRNLF